MGEDFVLVRVIGNPVAAEILEAETVGLRGIPEDLGGIVARRVGEDVPDDVIRKGVDAGDEGGGHRMLDFGCFCLLLFAFVFYVYCIQRAYSQSIFNTFTFLS